MTGVGTITSTVGTAGWRSLESKERFAICALWMTEDFFFNKNIFFTWKGARLSSLQQVRLEVIYSYVRSTKYGVTNGVAHFGIDSVLRIVKHLGAPNKNIKLAVFGIHCTAWGEFRWAVGLEHKSEYSLNLEQEMMSPSTYNSHHKWHRPPCSVLADRSPNPS